MSEIPSGAICLAFVVLWLTLWPKEIWVFMTMRGDDWIDHLVGVFVWAYFAISAGFIWSLLT